jgi:glycosyltransferase involved in cell wall biosynthesis
MACGCPVITCRNSSLPEVGGDAAIYVGEDDPSALAAALNRVLDPVEREARAAAGITQSAQFTWERSAQGIERALLAIVSGSESPTTR